MRDEVKVIIRFGTALWELFFTCFFLFNIYCIAFSGLPLWLSWSACNAGDLGWEDTLEKEMATHSSIWPGEFHGLYGLVKSWTRLSDFHFHCVPPRPSTGFGGGGWSPEGEYSPGF